MRISDGLRALSRILADMLNEHADDARGPAWHLSQRFVCPLCDSTDYRSLFELREDRSVPLPQLYQCAGCSFAFINPGDHRGQLAARPLRA
jgi:hypothetical protein